jgi:Tol biopolymer transport system component
MSPASGNANVFVRSLGGQGKWQVSPELGGYPRWSGDGRGSTTSLPARRSGR